MLKRYGSHNSSDMFDFPLVVSPPSDFPTTGPGTGPIVKWLGRRSVFGRPGFNPRPRQTKDVKTMRFAVLSLALGTNELGNRLAGSESV